MVIGGLLPRPLVLNVFLFFVLTNSQKQNTNKLVEEEQKGEADTHALSQTKK